MPDVADDVKYSEIRDIPWETEDCQSNMKIARDDFCKDFNFGFL